MFQFSPSFLIQKLSALSWLIKLAQKIEMFKDYLQQLKEIHEDKAIFQKKNQKRSLTKTLNRQEDKYQAYIIDQMSSQNRIIAAQQLASLIEVAVRPTKAQSFKNIQTFRRSSNNCLRSSEQSVDREENVYGSEEVKSNESFSVDLVLLKMSLNTVVRTLQQWQLAEKFQAFKKIKDVGIETKKISKIVKIVERMGLRQGLHYLKKAHPKPQLPQNDFFNDEFSMIATQKSRMRKGNQDESYLSFILDKENANSDCSSCKEAFQVNFQKDKELSKMKEELSYLKHLLAEKNLDLKKKQDQIDVLKQRSGDDFSDLESKNSSYYSQMERHVLGGKRTRKCGSIASNSSRSPKEQISKELLGKYMRQAFQLKETMDVARELCLDLQGSIPATHRNIFLKILNILNQGEEISLVDEY